MCDGSVVKLHNRFQAIAIDPVKRMIRVHAKSLVKRCSAPRPPCACPPKEGVCDVRQSRIVVNDLMREIDRLRRGFDWIDCDRYGLKCLPPLQNRDSCDAFASDGGNAGSVNGCSREPRKSYAVPPIGNVPLNPIPAQSTASAVSSTPIVKANPGLGALIDALA